MTYEGAIDQTGVCLCFDFGSMTLEVRATTAFEVLSSSPAPLWPRWRRSNRVTTRQRLQTAAVSNIQGLQRSFTL